MRLDEAGTDIEKIAMTYHSQRLHDTFLPDGTPATGASGFVLNGRPPIAGAPYADPAIELDGTPVCAENKPPCLARYKAADIQLDLVFNKKGQHYPQSRIITLWGDVNDTIAGTRTPEPFFFRANSTQVIEYWLANLVPNYYELDDFQVQNADRHPRAAHPPREVRRDVLGRRRQRVQLRGWLAQPAGGARSHREHQQWRRALYRVRFQRGDRGQPDGQGDSVLRERRRQHVARGAGDDPALVR